MSIHATYEATCDGKGCDARADLGLGDMRGAVMVAVELGWAFFPASGDVLCADCKPPAKVTTKAGE
jgi:hypothetical protein